MNEIPLLQIANTLADLKKMIPSKDANVLMIGRETINDGKGGFYRWDATSSADQDNAFYNVVTTNVLGVAGRWVRTFSRARSTAGGGILVNNGGVRAYFITGLTNTNGECVINLTEEGTTGGTALFTEIWSINATASVNATGPADAVQSYKKSTTANLKTTTWGFYKANALTITLGLLLVPVTSIGANVPISFRVEGV